jgi:hypothetical protein
MKHEANGLILIFLGEASACRQDGPSACSQRRPLTDCLQDRERSIADLGEYPGAGERSKSWQAGDDLGVWVGVKCATAAAAKLVFR